MKRKILLTNNPDDKAPTRKKRMSPGRVIQKNKTSHGSITHGSITHGGRGP